MSRTVEEVAEEIRSDIDASTLERMQFRLSDAIREGSKYGEQAYNWGDGERMCALSAAYASAKARNYA